MDQKLPFYTPPTKRLWGKLKPSARRMRHEPTQAEEVLWQRLRRKQEGGFRFRRQHTVDRFIVDFHCSSTRLVIEVDGTSHDDKQPQDTIPQDILEALGLRVLRFTNEQVLTDTDRVIAKIHAALPDEQPLPLIPSTRGGEGKNHPPENPDSPSSMIWGKRMGASTRS